MTKERQYAKDHREYSSEEIYRVYGRKCAICGFSLSNEKFEGVFRISGGCDLHHIEHFKDGGSDELNNLVLLCPNCHRMAHAGFYSKEYLKTLTLTSDAIIKYRENTEQLIALYTPDLQL